MSEKPETTFIRACIAGKTEVLQELLLSGQSPDTRDKDGLTGLIWAGKKGQIEVARVLCARGADLDAKDWRGRTALFHAVEYKHYDFVDFIAAEGPFLNPIDMHGMTPLDYASSSGDKRMIDLLKRLGALRKATQEPKPKRIRRNISSQSHGSSPMPPQSESKTPPGAIAKIEA